MGEALCVREGTKMAKRAVRGRRMVGKSSGRAVGLVRLRPGESGSYTLSDGRQVRVAASPCGAAPARRGPSQVRLLQQRPENSPAQETLQHQKQRPGTASHAYVRSHYSREDKHGF